MNFLLRKLLFWWVKNPTKGRICLLTLSIHLGFLVWASCTPSLKEKKKSHKIVVRTVHAPPSAFSSSKKIASAPSPLTEKIEKPKTSTPKKTSAPNPPSMKKQEKKVESEKNSLKNKTPPKPTSKPSKQTPAPSKELEKSIKEIEERIAKIASKNDKMDSLRSGKIPPKIELAPEPFSTLILTEEDYPSSLVAYLQEELKLQENGEVKIELTLRKDGSVEHVKVLSAKSEKNKKRLEENLPKLQFPPFPKEEKEKKKVFILTFCNDV